MWRAFFRGSTNTLTSRLLRYRTSQRCEFDITILLAYIRHLCTQPACIFNNNNLHFEISSKVPGVAATHIPGGSYTCESVCILYRYLPEVQSHIYSYICFLLALHSHSLLLSRLPLPAPHTPYLHRSIWPIVFNETIPAPSIYLFYLFVHILDIIVDVRFKANAHTPHSIYFSTTCCLALNCNWQRSTDRKSVV